VINTFSEVQISLVLSIRYHFKLVLRTVVGPIDIDPFFQRCQSHPQRSTSQWSVVKPSKEVSGCKVVIKDVFETCSMGGRYVELLKRLLRVAAWTIWQDALGSSMNGIPDHAAVDEGFETFHCEESSMDSKSRTSTGLARFAQIDKAVASWPTEFRFLRKKRMSLYTAHILYR